MRGEQIEVKLHGKWVGLIDVPSHSCLGDICEYREQSNGHLIIVDEGGAELDFRPVEWRVIED